MVPQYSTVFYQIHPHFTKGCPSSSVTALRDSTGFLLRQARWPFQHLAREMSFSVCVQVRVETSVSRAARLSRVRLATIWLTIDNDNDTLREVPHQSNEGLALQARVSGPSPHKKESVLLGKLAPWQGVQIQTVVDRV